MEIVVTSHLGTLSRGRHSARIGNGDNAIWANKDENGNLVIEQSGSWQLHCTDGFKRIGRAVLKVEEDGNWKMIGDTNRFSVISK